MISELSHRSIGSMGIKKPKIAFGHEKPVGGEGEKRDDSILSREPETLTPNDKAYSNAINSRLIEHPQLLAHLKGGDTSPPLWLKADNACELPGPKRDQFSWNDSDFKGQILQQNLTMFDFLKPVHASLDVSSWLKPSIRIEEPPLWLKLETQKRMGKSWQPSEKEPSLSNMRETLEDLMANNTKLLGDPEGDYWLQPNVKSNTAIDKRTIIPNRLQNARMALLRAIEENVIKPREREMERVWGDLMEVESEIPQLQYEVYKEENQHGPNPCIQSVSDAIDQVPIASSIKNMGAKTRKVVDAAADPLTSKIRKKLEERNKRFLESAREELEHAKARSNRLRTQLRNMKMDTDYQRALHDRRQLFEVMPDMLEDSIDRDRQEVKSWRYWHTMGKNEMNPFASRFAEVGGAEPGTTDGLLQGSILQAAKPDAAEFPFYLEAARKLAVAQRVYLHEGDEEPLAYEHTIREQGRAALGLGQYDDAVERLNYTMIKYQKFLAGPHDPLYGFNTRINLAHTFAYLAMAHAGRELRSELSDRMSADQLERIFPSKKPPFPIGDPVSVADDLLTKEMETRDPKLKTEFTEKRRLAEDRQLDKAMAKIDDQLRNMGNYSPEQLKKWSLPEKLMAASGMMLSKAYNGDIPMLGISHRPWPEVAQHHAMLGDFFGRRVEFLMEHTRDTRAAGRIPRSELVSNIVEAHRHYSKSLAEFRALDERAPKNEKEVFKRAMSHMEALSQGRPRERYLQQIDALEGMLQRVESLANQYDVKLEPPQEN